MTDRYQTTGPGGIVLQRASTQLSDHVTCALGETRDGRRAWIKARDGEPDQRLWCIEFVPNPDDIHRPTITPIAWRYAVTFDAPGNPPWIRHVRSILDRLCSPIPGGTP